jgi:hypothetical protein
MPESYPFEPDYNFLDKDEPVDPAKAEATRAEIDWLKERLGLTDDPQTLERVVAAAERMRDYLAARAVGSLAEQAAAEVLSRTYNRRVDIPEESEPVDHADAARAVVAAVRPTIAAETLHWVADQDDRWDGYCCHDHMAAVCRRAAEDIEAGRIDLPAALRADTEEGRADG